MAAGNQCCCFHVKTCAQLVAIFGIIGAVCSIISAILLWWYVPMSVILAITYIFVLVGVSKERPGYLLPAEIILGINVAISAIIIIALIIIGAVAPSSIVNNYVDADTNVDEARTILRVGFFVLAFIVFLASAYTIFSFIVIHRCRKYLLEIECSPHHHHHAPPTVYVTQQHPQPAYSPQPGYGPQPGYPPQSGYSPQPGYPHQPPSPYLQQGVPPQAGFQKQDY